jgi:oxygenase
VSLRLRTQSGPLRVAGTRPALVRLTPSSGDRGRFAIPAIHAIDEEGSLPGISTILLRPDGYVAWADDSEEDLDTALGKLLRTDSGEENAGL